MIKQIAFPGTPKIGIFENPSNIPLARKSFILCDDYNICSQSAFTCSKFTIETLEQGMEYVQSYQ